MHGMLRRSSRSVARSKSWEEIEFVIPADVSDAEAVFAAADNAERSLGPIDVWINDAMVTVFAPVWQITPEEFRRVTEVTYLGVVHGTMAALRKMRPADRERSFRSARRWPTAAFHCNQPIAEPSMRSAASRIPCVRS